MQQTTATSERIDKQDSRPVTNRLSDVGIRAQPIVEDYKQENQENRYTSQP